jgi:hypothetical protein
MRVDSIDDVKGLAPYNPAVFPTATTIDTGATKRRSKYNVSPPEERTYNGIIYHSKKEMHKAMELDLMKQAGLIDHWERQVAYDLPGGDKYMADFVTYKRIEVIEVKPSTQILK